MKRGIESRKAQFYLIAAIVIVFVIVSFAVVSNYISVKKEPPKFYDLGEILKTEGIHVVEHAEYKDSSVNDNINTYLTLFESYLKEHGSENIDVIIIYGGVGADSLQATRYSSAASEGGVRLSIGGANFVPEAPGIIKKEQAKVSPNPGANTVNVTLIGGEKNITQTLPVLQDNNFVFMMTTSDGFSQYVQSSLSPSAPQ